MKAPQLDFRLDAYKMIKCLVRRLPQLCILTYVYRRENYHCTLISILITISCIPPHSFHPYWRVSYVCSSSNRLGTAVTEIQHLVYTLRW